jgi:hypothetical protein
LLGTRLSNFQVLLKLTRHQKKRKVHNDKDPTSSPRSDDCLVTGADAMSSIQPSATIELPSTPQISLPLSEETPANNDGEPPTASITFDETTIESSSVVTEAAAPLDMN